MRAIAVFSQLLLLFLGVFLMIVVLLQRGRGGGLAGAFGGLGGQSAFGTKAGDVFTKITVVIAIAWVLVAGGSGYFLREAAEIRAAELGELAPEEPGMSSPGDTAPADGDQDGAPVGATGSSNVGEDGGNEPADSTGASDVKNESNE